MTDDILYDSPSTPSGSFKLNISGDEYLVRVMKPSSNASLNELQHSLSRNRKMLEDSHLAMHEACRDDLLGRVDKSDVDYFSPTQNALVARANIDVLIPLINVKGGVASYSGKLEGLPIDKHITKLRDKAEDNIQEERSSFRTNGYWIMLLVFMLTAGILWVFFS